MRLFCFFSSFLIVMYPQAVMSADQYRKVDVGVIQTSLSDDASTQNGVS